MQLYVNDAVHMMCMNMWKYWCMNVWINVWM